MRTPREHLAHLLQLAAEPGGRRELVRELADALTAWPADYPAEARASFAALLARVEHDIAPDARRELALKLVDCADAPLSLLNEFFFEVPPGARGTILARDARMDAVATGGIDEVALIETARSVRGPELANALAQTFSIDALTATEILQDATGIGIAIACRGGGVSRVAFSTLAVLTSRGDASVRLAAFDAVPERGAAVMLAFWRKQAAQHAQSRAA